MPQQSLIQEQPSASKRLLLPSLLISYIATNPPRVLLSILLIDISLDFNQAIGITGQVRAMFSVVGMISGLLMGIWSLRFSPKSLMLTGLGIICISVITSSLAMNFTMLLIVFSLTGIGLNMIEPILFVLIREHYPLELRARTIGWVMSGAPLVPILGSFIIESIAEVGGWRSAFLGFALPLVILGILMAIKGIPAHSQSPPPTRNTIRYTDGFKAIIRNRSAIACLVVSALGMGTYQALSFYGASFLRTRFLISISLTSVIYGGLSICYIIGLNISGRLANRIGKRQLTIFSIICAGILTTVFTNMTQLWSSVIILFIAGTFFGMMFTTFTSLTLEQVPQFQGTLMSLNSAAWSGGAAFGTGFGGFILLLFNYEVLGLFLGLMSLTTAIVLILLVEDRTSP